MKENGERGAPAPPGSPGTAVGDPESREEDAA